MKYLIKNLFVTLTKAMLIIGVLSVGLQLLYQLDLSEILSVFFGSISLNGIIVKTSFLLFTFVLQYLSANSTLYIIHSWKYIATRYQNRDGLFIFIIIKNVVISSVFIFTVLVMTLFMTYSMSGVESLRKVDYILLIQYLLYIISYITLHTVLFFRKSENEVFIIMIVISFVLMLSSGYSIYGVSILPVKDNDGIARIFQIITSIFINLILLKLLRKSIMNKEL